MARIVDGIHERRQVRGSCCRQQDIVRDSRGNAQRCRRLRFDRKRQTRAEELAQAHRVCVGRAKGQLEAARSLGAGDLRIILRHVLPQISPILIASTVLTIAVAIFDETALAFLGLGDPSRISLGKIIENAFQRTAISSGAWWAIVPPGAAVALLILSCSMIGRAMEDALNPRLRVSHLSAKGFRLRPLVGRGRDAV